MTEKPSNLNLSRSGSGNLVGAFWLIGSAVSACSVNVLTKKLSVPYPPFEILMIKSFVALAVLVMLNPRLITEIMKSSQWKDSSWKGLVIKALAGMVGNFFFIKSIQILPVSTVSALSMSSAIMTAVGGILFYHDQFRLLLWGSLGLGLMGALLIIQPDYSSLGIYCFFPLFSAFFFSVSSLLIKKLSRSYSPPIILLVLLGGMGAGSTLLNIIMGSWIRPSVIDGIQMILIGILYYLTQAMMVKAYIQAQASYLAPFKTIRYPINLLMGMVVLNEIPSSQALIGGVLILLSYYPLIHDNRLNRIK